MTEGWIFTQETGLSRVIFQSGDDIRTNYLIPTGPADPRMCVIAQELSSQVPSTVWLHTQDTAQHTYIHSMHRSARLDPRYDVNISNVQATCTAPALIPRGMVVAVSFK